MPMRRDLLGIAAMVAAMLAFVTNDALIKLAAESMPLGEALFIRGISSTAIVLILVLILRPRAKIENLTDRALLLRTFGDVAATLVYLTAITRLPIANATIVLQIVPLVVTLAGAILFREHVGWRRWTAILVGLAGVMIVIRPGLSGFNAYSLLALVAVFLVALRDVATRRVPGEIATITVVAVAVVANFAAAAALGLSEDWVQPDTDAALLALASGVSIVAAYWLIVASLRLGHLSLTAPFRYTVIVWAVLYGVFVWDDRLDTLTIIGAVLIVASGIFTLYRERKLASAPGSAKSAGQAISAEAEDGTGSRNQTRQ